MVNTEIRARSFLKNGLTRANFQSRGTQPEFNNCWNIKGRTEDHRSIIIWGHLQRTNGNTIEPGALLEFKLDRSFTVPLVVTVTCMLGITLRAEAFRRVAWHGWNGTR